MKMKVKTLTVLIVAMLVAVGGAVAAEKTITNKIVPKKIISAIIEADPEGDDYIYISPRGHGSVTIDSQSVSNEQAVQYVQRMMDEYPDHEWTIKRAHWTLAHLYRKMGNWDQAIEQFQIVAENNERYSHYQVDHAKRWIRELDTNPPNPDAEPALSGRVLIGEETTDQAFIYLMPANANHWYSPPRFHYPMTVTDDNGEYRFYENIEPGEYIVGVGIHPTKISGYALSEERKTITIQTSEDPQRYDIHFVNKMKVKKPTDGITIEGDTITFEWESYPGADSYRIGIGELLLDEDGELVRNGMIYLNDDWHGTTAEYSIEKLRKSFPGNASYSTEGVNPDSVLGIVYPGGNFTWAVQALDKKGNKMSDSSGYYTNNQERFPIFKIDDAGQLEGDRFVLAGDYDQAIEAYEKDLDEPYALRALAKIYSKGTDIRGEQHKDFDKALEYLNLIPDLTEQEKEWMESLEKKNEPTGNNNR